MPNDDIKLNPNISKMVLEGDPNGLGAKLADKAGDFVLDKTGSPVLAAAAKTAGDLAPMVLGGLRGAPETGLNEFVSPLKDLPSSSPGPNLNIVKLAKQYMAERGLTGSSPENYSKVSPERGARIANEFENMQSDPNHPEVKKAYDALASETLDQYKWLKEKAGLKFTPIEQGQANPYKNSTEAIHDITQNKHLYFYPTEQGFGTVNKSTTHPLLAPTDEHINGKPLLANDVFRIVHDVFGHAKEGVGFGPGGEENAWRNHMPMYSPDAQKALTTETRGQNSWVNYGPHGEANRANPANTTYADQKAGILPDWTTKEGYAEGGPVAPSFDDIQDVGGQMPAQPQMHQEAAPSFDQIEDASGQYETPGQQIAAGVEGVAKGIAGPLAPYLEKKLLKVPYSEQKARAEANPITHAVGQGAGLVGGMMTGAGEGALMAKAGEFAASATGLSEGASITAKVGSEAVKQAAEMAVLQSGDEVGKLVMQDPEASAQSALMNIGLASAFGAGGGAMMGAVSPLWKATIGDKVEKVLGGLKDHLDGTMRLGLPENVEASINRLNINVGPELRSAMTGDPKAAQMFNELREVQHPRVTAQLRNLETEVNDRVLQSIGKSPEEIANYSEAEGGRHAMSTFEKEYKAKYEPISREFDEVTKPFQEAPVSNVQIATMGDRIAQLANEKGYLGQEIPQNKIVDWLLRRIPSLKTAADFQKVGTEMRNMTHGDFAMNGVRRDMQSILDEAHHGVMAQAMGRDSVDLLNRFNAVRGQYADLAKLSNSIGSELGLGKFVGPRTLLETLKSKRSPEQFLRGLSPKGNAEILSFLGQHFPETLESIRDNELKQLIRPAILGAKGDSAINSKILNNAIEKGLAGQPERIKFALPNGALENIQAANRVMQSIPGMKSSGTAGWQQKLMAHVPQSALAGVAMVTGHNPILGYVGGHIGKLLSRDAPDAMKLAMLRFMSSDQPIKAEGFKSMVEFLHNTAKGQSLLIRATSNVFKANAQVLTDKEMPSKANREKLDEVVDKVQKSPEMLMRLTQSQVGHYLAPQQASLTQTQVQAIQYLQSIKPQPFQASPLDKPIEPSKDQMARYNRALDIANQPAIVLQHLKNGTIQANDLKDLNVMYPALMRQMQNKLTQGMVGKHANEEHIPYKTKMGLSLFLGQAVDSTMTPQAIMSAQPVPQAPQNQPSAAKTNKLGKSNSEYMTPNQKAESRNQNGK